MIPPPLPANESARLLALHDLNILDSEPEEAFDELARLASAICDTPISAVSSIDSKRQRFKARVGFDMTETAREMSFCGYAILKRQPMIVPDASKDVRFADNPLVVGAPHIRFYAGAPLQTSAGLNVGSLCVIDRNPRELRPEQQAALKSWPSR
jgi:GAF domain-containing protein